MPRMPPAITGARSARRRTSLAASGRSRASTPCSDAPSRRSTTPTAALRTSRREGAGDGIEDWDLPFAYEALARAEAIGGDPAESVRYETLAREAGEKIADDEDRDHLLSELGTLPGPCRR